MTIAVRNRFIRGALILAILLLVGSCVAAALAFAGQALPRVPTGLRPLPLLDRVPFAGFSSSAAVLAIAVFPLFSVVSLAYVLFAFEKTQTIELTFFAACSFALALEAFRLYIPLGGLWANANALSVDISRIALFSRLLAMLSLLAGIIFVTADNSQQTGTGIFILSFFAFTLAKAIPVNSVELGANFIVRNGYTSAIEFFLTMLAAMSVAGFLIQGLTRSVPEYVRAAFGLALFLAGYALLLACDAWLTLGAGTALFFGGSRLFLKSLHSLYLWQ